jgi:hypothetical protein
MKTVIQKLQYCAAYKIDHIELITNEIQGSVIHYSEKYMLQTVLLFFRSTVLPVAAFL